MLGPIDDGRHGRPAGAAPSVRDDATMAKEDAVAKRKTSPRTERRAQARASAEMASDRERLARLEAGGSPERPIEVQSSSQIEPHAAAMSCARCATPNRVGEHAAVTLEGQRLRLVRLQCPQCGAGRQVWFRIAPSLPN
jgi:RNase P subunit RPR2